jgi:hypothetical protein
MTPREDTPLKLRIGVWNLERSPVYSRTGAGQADHLVSADPDVWILTEVPADLRLRKGNVLVGSPCPGEKGQCWTAIASRWPLVPLRGRHPTLQLAALRHPAANVLVAASVLPWRSADRAWPGDASLPYAQQFAQCLSAHAAEIGQASHGYQLVWGGDFNQSLAGREYVGSLKGRALVWEAFDGLGLMPVTAAAAGSPAGTHAIDHIATPDSWTLETLSVERPRRDELVLSDHPAIIATMNGAPRSE